MPQNPNIKLSLLLIAASVLSACDSSSSSPKPLVENPAVAPVANAGPDLDGDEQHTITLVGSGFGSNGEDVTFQWTQTNGSQVSLIDDTQAIAHFQSPPVLISSGAQQYAFTLTVTNTQGLSSSDDMVVTVNPVNDAPVIEPIEEITAYEGLTFSLPANVSDPDGTIESYVWRYLSGNTDQLVTSDTATLVTKAPAVVSQQDALYELTVTDNEGATATKQVAVLVKPRELIDNTKNLILDDSELAINPSLIRSTDFDGDGDNDLITVEGERIRWYKNSDKQQLEKGSTLFSTQKSDATTHDILSVDMDNDGDLDIFGSFNHFSPRIGWLTNLGDGRFSSLNAVDSDYGISQTSRIVLTNVDGDDSEDLLAFYDKQLVWYKRIHSGAFEPKIVIANQQFSDAIFIDFDNDGDLDVLSVYELDNDVVLFTNNGNGNFTRYILARLNDATGLKSLVSADMDKNGFSDIILNTNEASLFVIYHFGNRGITLDKLDLGQFSSSFDQFEATDFDADGDVDIALSFLNTDQSSNELWLWRNSGQSLVGEFENLTTDYPVFSLHGADLVGDNNKELVLGSKTLHNISMVKTDVSSQITAITKSVDKSGIIDPQYVEIADVDQDGNNDLVIQSIGDSGKVVLLNGQGAGLFAEQKVLFTGDMKRGGLVVEDFNGDNLKDILIAPSENINRDSSLQGWQMFDNLGSNLFEGSIIADSQGSWVENILKADIDGDGDEDFTTIISNGQLAWFENTGAGLFTRHVLLDDWAYLYNIAVGDMDQDGAIDIIFEAGWAGEFRTYWLRNNGQVDWQLAGPIYSSATSASYELHIADLDNNGIDDLVHVRPRKTIITKGSGNGNFETPQPLGLDILLRSAKIADIDDDNDLDIVAVGSDKLHVFEQSDEGQMILNQSEALQTHWRVDGISLGDIDNDGDKDILLKSSWDNWIIWFKNSWVN